MFEMPNINVTSEDKLFRMVQVLPSISKETFIIIESEINKIIVEFDKFGSYVQIGLHLYSHLLDYNQVWENTQRAYESELPILNCFLIWKPDLARKYSDWIEQKRWRETPELFDKYGYFKPERQSREG